jgi:hypothetical protein
VTSIGAFCETHTLVVPDDAKEMVTLFHVSGVYTYVDPCGAVIPSFSCFSSTFLV